jgi:hypothetical protein
VERVRAKQQEVRSGRWVDPQGLAYLSNKRAVQRLREAQIVSWRRQRKNAFSPNALVILARQGKVKAIRPGFPESPKALWFLEDDIEREFTSLRQRAEGLRVVKGERCLILAAAGDYLGVSGHQILRWETFCATHPE